MASVAGRVGALFAKRAINGVQYSVEILIDLRIPEPQGPEPVIGKPCIALTVTFRMAWQIVLTTIDFNEQSML